MTLFSEYMWKTWNLSLNWWRPVMVCSNVCRNKRGECVHHSTAISSVWVYTHPIVTRTEHTIQSSQSLKSFVYTRRNIWRLRDKGWSALTPTYLLDLNDLLWGGPIKGINLVPTGQIGKPSLQWFRQLSTATSLDKRIICITKKTGLQLLQRLN